MTKTINFIAILLGISILAIYAHGQSIVAANESSAANEKIENEKAQPVKHQSDSDDNSWTGFYVGGFGGFTNGRTNPETSTVLTPNAFYGPVTTDLINKTGNQRVKSNGFNGGGTVGYNYQKGKIFVGGELDFGINRINQSVISSANFANVSSGFMIKQSVKSNWMMTARHRGGIALRKTLLYITGGLAVTDIKYDENFSHYPSPEATESGSFKKTKAGWTAGAGMEFKLVNRWSVKGEYLFSQFGKTSITSTNYQFSPFASLPFTHSTALKSHSLRFGVNYRF